MGGGLVTTWIDKPGIAPPELEEITGAAVVTFRVRVGETAGPEVGSKVGSGVESQPESRPESSTSPVPVRFRSLEYPKYRLTQPGERALREWMEGN